MPHIWFCLSLFCTPWLNSFAWCRRDSFYLLGIGIERLRLKIPSQVCMVSWVWWYITSGAGFITIISFVTLVFVACRVTTAITFSGFSVWLFFTFSSSLICLVLDQLLLVSFILCSNHAECYCFRMDKFWIWLVWCFCLAFLSLDEKKRKWKMGGREGCLGFWFRFDVKIISITKPLHAMFGAWIL